MTTRAQLQAALPADVGLVVRIARRQWTCICARRPDALANPNYRPDCPGSYIEPGEMYVEYLGESGAYSSGSRYHVACALNAWGGTPCGDDEDPRLPGVTR
jgi:hypothetical protein